MTTTSPVLRPLPPDLMAAEHDLVEACLSALSSGDGSRWSASLRFENLRVLPIALRLARALIESGRQVVLLWPDAGAAALARRDAEDLADRVLDFNQWNARKDPQPDALMLAVGPQPSEYEDFAEIKKKIWSMLDNAVKDRSSPFRIPVFICGNQSDFDGRIVVLRKSDQSNNLVQYHSDIRSDKIEKLKANKNASERLLAPRKLANKTSLTKPVTRELNILVNILEKFNHKFYNNI